MPHFLLSSFSVCFAGCCSLSLFLVLLVLRLSRSSQPTRQTFILSLFLLLLLLQHSCELARCEESLKRLHVGCVLYLGCVSLFWFFLKELPLSVQSTHWRHTSDYERCSRSQPLVIFFFHLFSSFLSSCTSFTGEKKTMKKKHLVASTFQVS